MANNGKGKENIKAAIIAALDLLDGWQLKLLWWLIREIIR